MATDHQPVSAVLRFWEDGRGPESGDEFSVLGAMTIAVAARNAVEDLHADGAFSDEQAPALNRQLRNRAYEVLLAAQLLAETGYDDQLVGFLADRAALDGSVGEITAPIAAMRGAIREAVRDFASSEYLAKPAAQALETAAVEGATDAFKALRSLDSRESAKEISYLARRIPVYWELPKITPERQELFGLVPSDA